MSTDLPGLLPLPTAALAARRLPIRRDVGPFARIHSAAYHPVFFGRSTDNRFNCPDQSYGVLYLAHDLAGAWVETIRKPQHRAVSVSWLRDKRRWARIEVNRPLRLVNLTGSDLVKLEIDNRINTGSYRVAQAWARALHDHPEEPDGLRYVSRHNPSQLCVALFDRAEDAVETVETFRFDVATMVAMAKRYGHSLVP